MGQYGEQALAAEDADEGVHHGPLFPAMVARCAASVDGWPTRADARAVQFAYLAALNDGFASVKSVDAILSELS